MLGLATGAAPAAPSDPQLVLLQRFVDESGRVDYADLKADRAGLDAVVDRIARQDTAAYAAWSENERLAFWINTYNMLTLRLIVDHYPIQPAPGRQAYPANSIRQIPGAWKRIRFEVMGTPRTLDEIEHRVIRVEFQEPRVHMALVCAAVSCPPLRREPYSGDRLGDQLDDQARRFFADLRNLHVDRERSEVWVSSIIQWFADDIVPGVMENNARDIGERKAMLAFVPHYVPEDTKRYLEGAEYRLEFFAYDWTLNDQTE
jgi:hypothetical protein